MTVVRSRTRVGSTPDLQRLSNGVSRPGIDPRIWCSYGYVLEDSKLDTKHGDFVEVALLPSELELTCRVPQAYAGDGFGSNDGRLKQDDEVLVLIPDGDPAHGGTVIGRYWNGAISLPDLAKDNPNDWVRQLAPDLNWRIKLTGKGQWQFEGEDEIRFKTSKKGYFEADTVTLLSDNVRLGDENATEKVILGSSFRQAQSQMNSSLETAIGQLGTAIQTLGTSLTFAGVLIPAAALAAKAAVAAFAVAGQLATQAMSQAVSDFESAASLNQDFNSNVATVKK